MTLEVLSLIHEIGQWVIRLAIIPVLARENRPSIAWAWLALFAFVPWLALVLYLLFGRPTLRRRLRRHSRARAELRERGYPQAEWGFEPGVLPWLKGLARMNERLTTAGDHGVPVVGGNSAELLTGTGATIDRIVDDIERAERHVHLLFFVFNGDATGRRIAEALAGAVERGVTCRVLVDAFGSRVEASPSFFASLAPWLEERGVEVRAVQAARLTRRALARFDVRNHRKIAVVDGTTAYTGSLNIHDSDFGLEDGRWRQTMARLEGPAVRQLQLLFVEDWSFAAGELLDAPDLFPEIPERGTLPVQVVPGGPEYEESPIQHLLAAAIHSGQERVIITSPYFVPDEPLQLALRVAALRGTRVDLILPEVSDRASADAAARAYLDELLQAGVHVHLFSGGLLHAKAMSVDDQVAILGSANFDRRSLFLNYEANVVVYDSGFAAQLRARQEEYLSHCKTLGPGWWEELPALRRQLYQTAKLLSPLL